MRSQISEPKATIPELDQRIKKSYAHNSRLYEYLEKKASLPEIREFLSWDARQPPFHHYLRLWLDALPPRLRPALEAHLREEEDEDHAGLFRNMLHALGGACAEVDEEVLRELNYPFSRECRGEKDFAFFVGGFWATEIMSAKRCASLYRGLKRNEIAESPLTYLRLHMDGDIRHQDDVRENLVRECVAYGAAAERAIREGVEDRLRRSESFLRWYETRLG